MDWAELEVWLINIIKNTILLFLYFSWSRGPNGRSWWRNVKQTPWRGSGNWTWRRNWWRYEINNYTKTTNNNLIIFLAQTGQLGTGTGLGLGGLGGGMGLGNTNYSTGLGNTLKPGGLGLGNTAGGLGGGTATPVLYALEYHYLETS